MEQESRCEKRVEKKKKGVRLVLLQAAAAHPPPSSQSLPLPAPMAQQLQQQQQHSPVISQAPPSSIIQHPQAAFAQSVLTTQASAVRQLIFDLLLLRNPKDCRHRLDTSDVLSSLESHYHLAHFAGCPAALFARCSSSPDPLDHHASDHRPDPATLDYRNHDPASPSSYRSPPRGYRTPGGPAPFLCSSSGCCTSCCCCCGPYGGLRAALGRR